MVQGHALGALGFGSVGGNLCRLPRFIKRHGMRSIVRDDLGHVDDLCQSIIRAQVGHGISLGQVLRA